MCFVDTGREHVLLDHTYLETTSEQRATEGDVVVFFYRQTLRMMTIETGCFRWLSKDVSRLTKRSHCVCGCISTQQTVARG